MLDTARAVSAEIALNTMSRLVGMRYGLTLADGGIPQDVLDRLAGFLLLSEAERPSPWLLPWCDELAGASLRAAAQAGARAVRLEWNDDARQGRGGIVAVPVA